MENTKTNTRIFPSRQWKCNTLKELIKRLKTVTVKILQKCAKNTLGSQQRLSTEGNVVIHSVQLPFCRTSQYFHLTVLT